MKPNTLKLQLTINVDYTLNGADPADLRRLLGGLARAASGEGLLSGDTEAEVDGYQDTLVDLTSLISKPLTRAEIDSSVDENKYLRCIVAVPMSVLVKGVDARHAFVEAAVVGDLCFFVDISYTPVGVDADKNVLIEVFGQVEEK